MSTEEQTTTDYMPGAELRARGYRIEYGASKFRPDIPADWRVCSNGTIGAFVAAGETEALAWANAVEVTARFEAAQAAARRPFPVLLKAYRRWRKDWQKDLTMLSREAEGGMGSYAKYDESAADMREENEEWCFQLLASLPQTAAEWKLIHSALRKAAKGEGGEKYAAVLATLERGA